MKTNQIFKFLQSLSPPLMILNTYAEILFYNHAFQELYSLKKLEWIGKDYFNCYATHKLELPFTTLEQIVSGTKNSTRIYSPQSLNDTRVIHWQGSLVQLDADNSL